MFIIANFFLAVGQILDILLSIYMWVIIIGALISWVNPDPYNPIVRFLYTATDPVLRPIRMRIGLGLGIDISPIIVILIILFIRKFFIASLIELALKMKGG